MIYLKGPLGYLYHFEYAYTKNMNNAMPLSPRVANMFLELILIIYPNLIGEISLIIDDQRETQPLSGKL